MTNWQPIESAPYDLAVEVKVGEGMTFIAALARNASMNSDEQPCDQWQAVHEGEHPPCWSEGACWSSNVDDVTSLQPTAWRMQETSND